MKKDQTHDLGLNWKVTFWGKTRNGYAASIHNPETGEAVNLDSKSLDRLREIFNTAGRL